MEFKVVHIDETDSTNRWLREYDRQSDSPLVVVAGYQTAGQGCGTNSWESERGQNLLFSVLLHPYQVPAASQFILSMANALALKDVLDDYIADVKIKWPNDIYWKDCKICGTLIETSLQGSQIRHCIIGTGLNVNQREFHSDAPNPVSMYQILGHETDCQEMLRKVLDRLGKYMDMVMAGDWEPIRTRYRYHLYRYEETHRYRFCDGSEEECKLVNVTDDGHLELLAGGRERYHLAFKEVQFII